MLLLFTNISCSLLKIGRIGQSAASYTRVYINKAQQLNKRVQITAKLMVMKNMHGIYIKDFEGVSAYDKITQTYSMQHTVLC